jgi:hypothetical protein
MNNCSQSHKDRVPARSHASIYPTHAAIVKKRHVARAHGKTVGDWLILRSPRSKMCLSPAPRRFCNTLSRIAGRVVATHNQSGRRMPPFAQSARNRKRIHAQAQPRAPNPKSQAPNPKQPPIPNPQALRLMPASVTFFHKLLLTYQRVSGYHAGGGTVPWQFDAELSALPPAADQLTAPSARGPCRVQNEECRMKSEECRTADTNSQVPAFCTLH